MSAAVRGLWLMAVLAGCSDRDRDGLSLAAGDCDDSDPKVLGQIHWFADEDGDGFAGTPLGLACAPPHGDAQPDDTDCNDRDSAIHPEVAERCDATDNDCDGEVDEEQTFQQWWPDEDGDGYGDAAAEPQLLCDGPSSAFPSQDNTDCDDSNPAVHPDLLELCGDSIDQDCDPETDCEVLSGIIEVENLLAVRSTHYEAFAAELIDLGDLDGDGRPDLLAGNPLYTPDPFSPPLAGRILWLEAPYPDANGDGLSEKTNDDYQMQLLGKLEDAELGRIMAVGDEDGDGALDLVAGCPKLRDELGNEAGRALLFVEPFVENNVLDLEAAALTAYGSAGAGVGVGVALADVTGDAATDWLVGYHQGICAVDRTAAVDGAVQIDPSAGRPAPCQQVIAPFVGLGEIEVGDLNGDGFPDVLSADAGAAHFHSGPLLGDPQVDEDSLLPGLYGPSSLPIATGDVDGDGIADAVTCQEDQVAIYQLLSEPSLAAALARPALSCTDLSFGGDFDNSGTTDLLIGASAGSGAVYLFFLPLGPGAFDLESSFDASVQGFPTSAWISAAGAGDIDGDNRDDFWVSAPDTFNYDGQIWLVPGLP